MTEAADWSESLAGLIREMGIITRDQGCVYGAVNLDQSLLSLLPNLLRLDLVDGIVEIDLSARNIEDLAPPDIGKAIKIGIIELSARRYIHFYESIDELISVSSNRLRNPQYFYLIDSGYFYPYDQPSSEIKHYFDLIKFLSLLTEKSDYQSGFSDLVDSLVFLHKGRLDLPLKYASSALSDSLDGLSVICGFFGEKEHSEQKKSILKEVLSSMLAAQPAEARLGYLVENFGEFSRRFTENYQFFVSEFSFDAVRLEYEEKKREYLSDLNDVFSSAQTKMLGVPVSLAVVAYKMSPVISGVPSLLVNFLLLLSVVAYSIMMKMLIGNQRHTLDSIKSEYESHMARLQFQYSDQYEKVSGVKADLDKRYNFQIRCMSGFAAMSYGLISIVAVMFLYYFPWNKLIGYFSDFEWWPALTSLVSLSQHVAHFLLMF